MHNVNYFRVLKDYAGMLLFMMGLVPVAGMVVLSSYP
jgi:hypothetical protein